MSEEPHKDQTLLWVGLTVVGIVIAGCCLVGVVLVLGAGFLTPVRTVSITQVSSGRAVMATPTPIILIPLDTLPPVPPSATELPVTSAPSRPPVSPGDLRVYYVDVGQGDSILILSPDGKTILIDGGETNTGIVSFLQSMGVQQIDVMVATHPHSDHIGGLVQVLNAMPVAKVVTNGQAANTSTYEHFLDGIAAAKAEYVEVKRGDTLTVGTLSFAVLNPTTTTGDTNHNSLVLRLVYGQVPFLFMGDADMDAEADMLSAGFPLQAAILKVGHHGSYTASSPAFLSQVKPEIAVYSAGAGNSYGHPHAEPLAALAAVGATIYGTDVNGTVLVTTDGVTYHVATSKGQEQSGPVVVPVTSAPQPTASGGTGQGVCDCSGNLYNCSYFQTHAEAQACYEYCVQTVGKDIHRLDGDSDGQACESLP